MNVNVFSKKDFIQYLEKCNITESNVSQSNEYFISILPEVGPDSLRVFQADYRNVITLLFDDVAKDEPREINGIKFIARAMTLNQAHILVNFIKTIPHDSIINIHCIAGTSRSMAVAKAIHREYGDPHTGNKYVYHILTQLLNKES